MLWSAIFTQGQFWPMAIVFACPCLCVCISVCPNMCQQSCLHDISSPVQARITKFGSGVEKTLINFPNVEWLTLISNVKFNLKSKFTSFWACLHLSHFQFACTVTHQAFKQGSANLDQRCKIPLLRSLLWVGVGVGVGVRVFDLDLQGKI